MKQEIIDRLLMITPEEQAILDGKTGVRRELYTNIGKFEIDNAKLMERGRYITVRPHTRFVDFPEHTHNYIEIMYVCQGSITQFVEGSKIVMKKGDILFLNQHARHSLKRAGREDIGINFIALPEFFDIPLAMLHENNVLADFLVNTLRTTQASPEYLLFSTKGDAAIENLMENIVASLLPSRNENYGMTSRRGENCNLPDQESGNGMASQCREGCDWTNQESGNDMMPQRGGDCGLPNQESENGVIPKRREKCDLHNSEPVESSVEADFPDNPELDNINQVTMGLVFLHLLYHADMIDRKSSRTYQELLAESALQYIHKNYKDASLNELAANFHQSVSQVSKLIKKMTGFTYKELLQRRRFERAVELLKDTALPVADIFHAVGYENSSYFYTMFHEKYGMSPREFRQKNH